MEQNLDESFQKVMERERIEGQGDFSDFVAIFEQAFTTLQEDGNEEGLGRSL